ncbi:Nucleotide-binding universal stress protein, UspA family [Halogeometricum rufum]|uniref:Nucleotide-binding universal stress protein, UspA family n=1 Tax=Halogeometricum rufum TaxID=553469 RepID=A0A1I6IPR6_9EURY|nr:universal stress protein [Halogeometricum rufum]SFR68724.1 Nucleotide-binding universal stress protein, UspA family [Halogeometricum rufum]
MAVLAAIGEEEASKRVIEVAADLATAYDDTLVVVHVIPEQEVDEHIRTMRELPGYSDTGVSDESDRAADFVRRMVEQTLDREQRERVDVAGRVGRPETQVRSVAEEVDARYVVIGGRNQSPVGKAMFGSTTQSILLNSDRPVLTVRTPDSS